MIVSISVSRDGKKVAFPEIIEPSSDLHRNICIYDLNKKTIIYRKISSFDEFDPCFSKDGESLLFCSRELGNDPHGFEKPAHLKIVNIKSNNVKKITNDVKRSDFNPRFSHDEKKIVFDGAMPKSQLFSRGDIYLYEIDTQKITRLTNENLVGMPYPTFFGDDESILINIENEEKHSVYLAILKKKNHYKPEPITRSDSPDYGVLFPFEMSKTKILCTVNNKYKYELSVLEKGAFQILSKSGACFSSPVFNATTNTVFWVSGNINLFALDMTTKKVKKIAGREIFYKKNEDIT